MTKVRFFNGIQQFSPDVKIVEPDGTYKIVSVNKGFSSIEIQHGVAFPETRSVSIEADKVSNLNKEESS